jgi:hypothetical protein
MLGMEHALALIDQSEDIHPDIAVFSVNAHAEHASALLAIGRIEDAEREARSAYEQAEIITRVGGLGLPGVAYAEVLAARGDHRAAIEILTPLLSGLWQPPLRSNPRLLALRMAVQLATSHSAVGNDSQARYYQNLAEGYTRVTQ